MDATGPLARRFPLVARPRPGCPPLDRRVKTLCALAESAARNQDRTRASAVLNQAALLASDVGLPELARQWCHRHAAVYLRARPLDAQAARHGLEPLVNLARLAVRDGDGDAAFHLLTTLADAVSARVDTTIDGTVVPAASLTATDGDHNSVCTWLWTVLLSDGTRALTSVGRWREAHEHLRRRRGIGQRLLDGRQVAVLAHFFAGDPDTALALLNDTSASEPWEEAVAACLTVLCLGQNGGAIHTAQARERYLALAPDPGLLVFRVRLGLTLLHLVGASESGSTELVDHLASEVIQASDGYVARDILGDEAAAALISGGARAALTSVVHASGLGVGTIPPVLMSTLLSALERSEAAMEAVLNTPTRSSGSETRSPPPTLV
ncbi:hypothetical protein HII36_02260 [Nonomuraea sp. NN258]|uniref:hypothetical protein n=1 Tax=Nonomuraea antri TaxID=2730852 RepID=UPI0015682046|nr:hypothetical protein [Nonomuraea antri]NRQ30665.1 hypothetical protein [Nonomuraea antri]